MFRYIIMIMNMWQLFFYVKNSSCWLMEVIGIEFYELVELGCQEKFKK
jgi:hypothetical protein